MPKLATVLEGRYRLDALIGRGGMADVYRGIDLRLDRAVAVKVLREVEHERRFEVETHTLATLDHPNLVRLLDAGSDDGQLYLVMELLGGASVHELLAQGPVEPGRVADIGREAAAALDYIHERGIVHRDVKPSNLMFDDRGTLRLADFGIVRLIGGVALTATHQTIGTMAYLAPEQLRGEDIGPSADVYALGLVLLECLTGTRAFSGSPAEAGAARLHRDPDVPSALPHPWTTLLQAMTDRDPGLRPTAAATRERLDGPSTEPRSVASTAVLPAAAIAAAEETVPAIAAAGDAASRAATANPPQTGHRRRLMLVVGGAAVAAVVAAGLWVAATDDPTPAPAVTGSTVPERSSPPSTVQPVTTTPPTTIPAAPVTQPPPEDDTGNSGRGNGNGNGKGKGGEKGESGDEGDD